MNEGADDDQNEPEPQQSRLSGAQEEGVGKKVVPPSIAAYAKSIYTAPFSKGGLGMKGGRPDQKGLLNKEWRHMYKEIPNPTLHQRRNIKLDDMYMSGVRIYFWAPDIFFPW
jgi:hypothetical protein